MGIQVMVKRPNENLEILNIEDNLEELQSIVEGYIEYVPVNKLSEKNIEIIVNDEGKINGLEASLAIGHKGNIVDVICGNAIFISFKKTRKGIESDSLNEDQIIYIKDLLSKNAAVTTYGDIIPVIEI